MLNLYLLQLLQYIAKTNHLFVSFHGGCAQRTNSGRTRFDFIILDSHVHDAIWKCLSVL